MGITAGFGTLNSNLIFEVEDYLKHIGIMLTIQQTRIELP